MIPLVPTSQAALSRDTLSRAALDRDARGLDLPALFREMVQAWLAHHQRLIDLGLNPPTL